MIARTLFRAVVPTRGAMATLGGHRTLSKGSRDLGRKNIYFGHECERKFWEIPPKNSEKNTFDLR